MINKDIVKIFALGGLDENGKNMYIVEINEDIFVLEAGFKHPEKSSPGIDVIIPDFTYLIENKDRVKAYIITHGHDDSMGSLAYVLREVPAPVYCSKVSKEMIEDTLKKLRQKVDIDYRIVKPTSDIKIENRKVSFFSTTHSVAQSMGVAICTSQGYIVYTGDFIIESSSLENFDTDLKALAKIAENDILCLMSESGGALKGDFTSPNHRLETNIRREVQEHDGRVIVALYTQNLFALQEVVNMSKDLDKKVLIFSKDLNDLVNSFEVKGLLEIPSNNRATLEDLSDEEASKDLIVVVSGNGEKLFRNIERIANGELSDDKGLEFNEKDLFIMAAPSTPGTDVMAVLALDDVYKSGAKVMNISGKQMVSMHAHKEDLKLILSLLRPKYYFPVSGYYNELMENATLALKMNIGLNPSNILVNDNGMVARFENGLYSAKENFIKTGELMIDGLGVFDAGSVVINDRNKLADDGVIILGVTLDKTTKEVVAGPDVQARGLFFVKNSDDLLKKISNLYVETVIETYKNSRIDYNEKKMIVRDTISKYIRKEMKKSPIILSMILEI